MRIFKNFKTLTSGSSRGDFKTLKYGQYIHVDYNGYTGQTYLCVGREGQRGRTGGTKLTLQSASGEVRTVDASNNHYNSRRCSISEILAFKAQVTIARHIPNITEKHPKFKWVVRAGFTCLDGCCGEDSPQVEKTCDSKQEALEFAAKLESKEYNRPMAFVTVQGPAFYQHNWNRRHLES